MTLATAASLLAAALTVLGVFLRLIVYRRARIEARREYELEQAKASARAAEKAREIADDVARIPDADLRKRLDRFVRKN